MDIDTVHCCDWEELLEAVTPGSVNMILADLPYGITQQTWDRPLPWSRWWYLVRECLAPTGSVVLTASQPFTSQLLMTFPKWFRHEWIWIKSNGTGFLNAQSAPLKYHESILVFAPSAYVFNPQKWRGLPNHTRRYAQSQTSVYNPAKTLPSDVSGCKYPRSVLFFDVVPPSKRLHPNQKPVALFEYLVRTYTNPGDLVVDPAVGSGTTAVAVQRSGRHFVVGDIGPECVDITRQRLLQLPLFVG